MLNSMTLCGEALVKYSIVYPQNGNSAEIYAAIVLQNHFYENLGSILPTHDDSVPENGLEILIGKTNRGEVTAAEQSYSVYFAGKRLQAVADGYFGYLALARYLKNDLFTKETALDSGFSHAARYE